MTLCFKWMLGIKTSIQNNTCIAVRTFGIIHVNICIPGMLHMLYIKFIYICYYIIHTPIAFWSCFAMLRLRLPHLGSVAPGIRTLRFRGQTWGCAERLQCWGTWRWGCADVGKESRDLDINWISWDLRGYIIKPYQTHIGETKPAFWFGVFCLGGIIIIVWWIICFEWSVKLEMSSRSTCLGLWLEWWSVPSVSGAVGALGSWVSWVGAVFLTFPRVGSALLRFRDATCWLEESQDRGSATIFWAVLDQVL